MEHRAAEVLALAAANAHARDAHIVFVEDGHAYFLDGVQLRLSVTGLIHEASSNHFVAKTALASMKKPGKWPSAKYSDADATTGALTAWSDARILQSWADNGAKASALGTDLHAKIERHLNGLTVDFPEGAAADPDSNYAEFQYFLNWWAAQTAAGFVPFRTEWVIYDEAANLAGSIDFIMYNTRTKRHALVDWKRCKTNDAGFRNSFRRKFLPPLAHLDDHKHNKWALQVNTYREVLERYYGLDIESMAMVVCHCENPEAEVFSFPRSGEAQALLEARRARMAAAARPAVEAVLYAPAAKRPRYHNPFGSF